MYDIEGMMGRVNDTYKNARGNMLAGLAFNSQGDERKSALGQLAGIDVGAAQKLQNDFNEQDASELAQFSQMILAAPDDVKTQMYERGKQRFGAKIESLGGQIPATVQEALPFFQQLAGGQQGTTKVHSQYMGDDGNMRVIMSDGSEKAMGKYSPKYTPHYGADGSVSGYNSRTNELSNTTVPNGAPPESQSTAASAAGQLQAIYNKLLQGGMAPAKAEEMAFSVLRESGVIEAPQQAKVSVAPKGEMTQYQAEKLAMDKASYAQGQADRKAKVENVNMLKGEAARKRNEAVVMSVDDTLTTIDRLEKSAGYKELGTAMGDIKIGTPLIRNDAKDANATLKTLAGQIALSTMANLKTLSSAGATGFGALTAPELSLLQNSIATLQQENVSNPQIVESIRVIKDKMRKIKDAASGGQRQAPIAPSNPASNALKVGRFTIESN